MNDQHQSLEDMVKSAYEQAQATGVTLELLTQLVAQVREAERAQCCSIAKQALKGAVMSKYANPSDCSAARDMAQRIVNDLHFNAVVQTTPKESGSRKPSVDEQTRDNLVADADYGWFVARGKKEPGAVKQIVYVATDSGIDGRAPEKVLYAAFDEQTRDDLVAADKSRNWRGKKEVIVDVGLARKQALAKLDGIDRLVLGLKPWPDN